MVHAMSSRRNINESEMMLHASKLPTNAPPFIHSSLDEYASVQWKIE